MDEKTTGASVGDWKYSQTGGTKENPLVFIDDPNPLQGEEWDTDFNRYNKFRQEGKFLSAEKNTEISSYGRVKISGVIQKPSKTAYGMKTTVRGTLSDYQKHRPHSKYGGKTKRHPNRRAGVPYGVSVQMLSNLGEDIPDDAELFVDGNSIGSYQQYKQNPPKIEDEEEEQGKEFPFLEGKLNPRKRKLKTHRGGRK